MAGISKLMPAALGYDIGELVIAPCSFATNTTSDPSSSTFRGDVLSSVSYAATGVFTATVRDLGYEVVAAIVDAMLATATTDAEAQLKEIDTTANTLTIQWRKSSDATALAPAGTSDRVNIVLFLRRKSVARRRS